MEKLNYEDLEKVVAGKSLKEWCDRVLSCDYEYRYTETEAVRLWAWNKNLENAISKLSEELEEWEDWKKLQEEEKEVLKECLVKVITDVWRYSWEVIRFVLSDKPKDWREGKPPRGTIEEAMMRITEIGLARNTGEQNVVKDIVKKLVEEENEEWKEWLGRKVWLNLAEEMME